METMLIELTNEKAAKLLHELEALNLIKVIQTNSSAKESLANKYRGSLPSDLADEMQNHVNESRNEWNGRSI